MKFTTIFFFSVFLAFSPIGELKADLAYIVNNDSANITVINTFTQEVVSTIPLTGGTFPRGIVFSPDSAFFYISANLAILEIDTATNAVTATTTVVASSAGIDITPDGQFLYTARQQSNVVNAIDTLTHSIVATISVTAPFSVAITPNGDFAYVSSASLGGTTVQVISTATNTIVDSVTVGTAPRGVIAHPNGNFVYVAAQSSNVVNVISTATNDVVATISVGLNSNGLGITPSGAFLYVTNSGANTVSVINTATRTVISTIPVSDSPEFATSTLDGRFIYVSNTGDSLASSINTASNIVVATLPTGGDPSYIAMLSNGVAPSSSGVQGYQISNRFLTQSDLTNVISWDPPANFTPVAYSIYRDSSFVAMIPASELRFEDHNRKKKQFYSYSVLGVDATESTLEIGSITVAPIY